MKKRNGIENTKNQILTSNAMALIFWDSAIVNPKGNAKHCQKGGWTA